MLKIMMRQNAWNPEIALTLLVSQRPKNGHAFAQSVEQPLLLQSLEAEYQVR